MTSVFEKNSEVLKCTFLSLRNVHGCSSCYELPALQDLIVENTEKLVMSTNYTIQVLKQSCQYKVRKQLLPHILL